MNGAKNRKLRLASLLLPHWKLITLGLFAVIVQALVDLLQPWPLKIVVDLVGSKPMPEWMAGWVSAIFGTDKLAVLNFVGVAVVLTALLGAVSSYAESVSMTTVGQWIAHDLRSTLYNHIQRLSLPYHDRSRTGDLISRITSDIDTIQGFITSTLTGVILDSLTLVSMLAVMTYIDWRFTLIALSVAPFLFAFVYMYSPRIKKASRAVRKKESEIVSQTQEVFSSIRVVKAFGQEKYEKERFKEASLETVELALRARALKAGLSPGIRILTAIATAAMMWYGARMVVVDGTVAPGTLVLLLAYLRSVYSPIRSLSRLPDTFSKPSIAFERIQEIMDLETKIRGQEKPQRAPDFKGRIEFENVSFAYTPDQPVLKDVNFTIEPGQIAAFVGPTGAGKTTIISLIPRFYEVTSGAIRIDGEDVRKFRLKSLRKQLGFVLQETLLFHAPIGQNIAYGRPTATREEIIEAAKLANVHDFIEQLPEGYDTIVGERGITVSGGQRQRIGIARAIIRGAPILILDEPTSGLDAVSEAIVFDALHRLMTGKTCIVITHRLTTIRRADVIFVLQNGSIVQSGNHEQLLAQGGLYRELYETQFRGSGTIADGKALHSTL